MSASQPAYFHLQGFSDIGAPLVGGRLYTYTQGTTAHKTAYTDIAGAIPQTYTADGLGGQYIALNARGELPAPLYMATGPYDIALKRADGSTVWTRRADAIGDGLVGYITSIASSIGASLIGFIQAGAGAILRTVMDKLREQAVSPADFGPVGTADDTAVWQRAMDAVRFGGTIDGQGLTYNVNSILWKSFTNVENFDFVTIGGNTDGRSPITIDGRAGATKQNIRIRNFTINGNRPNQTNITGAAGEDGARHGVRMLSRCTNILIEDFEITNCGTDGLELFSAGASVSDADKAFTNITIRRFKTTGNRRHGMSADSFKGLTIKHCYDGGGNGLDLNLVDVATHGNRGARVGNTLANPVYGSFLDVEGYGIGSCFDGLRLHDIKALGNARSSVIIYDPVDQTTPGFIPRRNIWITDCEFDAGIDASSDGRSLSLTSSIANTAKGTLYESVFLSGNKLTGGFLARACNRLTLKGGEINHNSSVYYVALDHSNTVLIDTNVVGSGTQVYADTSTYFEAEGANSSIFPADPVLTFSGGAAGGGLAAIVYTQRENRHDGVFTFLVTANYTPAAGGLAVLALAAAVGSAITDPALVNVINNNDGSAILNAHNPTSGEIRFTSAGAGIVHKIQILVHVNA